MIKILKATKKGRGGFSRNAPLSQLSSVQKNLSGATSERSYMNDNTAQDKTDTRRTTDCVTYQTGLLVIFLLGLEI